MYAGKSTIAEALVDMGYQRMAFAAPLKNVAALAYGTIDKSAMYDVVQAGFNEKEDPSYSHDRKSGRQILQEVGQALKFVDRDFWIKCFQREAKMYEGTPLVVDDLRFMFEMETLRQDGWFIVGVNTPLDVRMERAERLNGKRPSESELNHESEREVPEIIKAADYVVSGQGDPYVEVMQLMARWNAYH